ncbi:MUC2L protein, partial [Campylorhamphus procurvoides]|nr:MUC2L protein [Campylorhamphus procurvoides]
ATPPTRSPTAPTGQTPSTASTTMPPISTTSSSAPRTTTTISGSPTPTPTTSSTSVPTPTYTTTVPSPGTSVVCALICFPFFGSNGERTTKTTPPGHTLSTLSTPATLPTITMTTISGPSSPKSTPGSTLSVPSVSTSPTPVTTSGTTPTVPFTTTSGTSSSSFTIGASTTTSTTFKTLSPGSTSTSGPTATSTAITTTGSESWWLCNCTKAICIEDNIVQVIPIICNPPPKPTCTNGLSPVPVIDEDGCCWHWECDCYCTGWGDPHYMTFDGLYYSYQGNCTYVLVEEINKKVDNFGVYIDNYHCDARDVVSCPRTLIVRHETQEVRMTTVKPNTLQVEVTVNNQLVALPYKKFGVSIYESGINRVVEIPELKMNVTYNGLSFSIRMPYSLFGNNTQGQCGTCNNNTADDCMLPDGNIAENCETMADHWQVVDPSKPQCSPGLVPTGSPSTTPTEPCKESSICKLLFESVFKPCHEFVRPEKYYAACVFDSCILPNLNLECSSLQIYAATCADQGVCIDWRGHTDGVCSHECPPGKEYRACGPIKEITCKSSHQNETSTKQVEGCFCPNGTMLYDTGVDVCVKTCGCVGVDMIPREFGEKFTVDCQDCICLEGEHGIVCQPHVCGEHNKVTCDGEGFYQVTEVNPEDSCCPLVTCKCNTSFCTAKVPKCSLGFEVHSYIPSGQCCPVYQCVPKGVCVHQSAEFLPNSSVYVDKCQNCVCTNEVNISTQLNIISCEPVPCNTYCKPGYEIKPVKGECCGRCVQTKCIINTANNAELILSPGEFKNDPTNNCTIYSCVDVRDQLIASTSEITCPAFNEESCKPGTISFLPNGCCKTCAPVDSRTPCSVRQREDFIVYKGCRSVDRVVMTECEGTCGTFSLYSAEANSMDHSCSCCRETATTEKHVVLKCPNGHSISHKYMYVESCSCQDTECSNSGSNESRNREENDRASSLNRIKRAISLTSK